MYSASVFILLTILLALTVVLYRRVVVQEGRRDQRSMTTRKKRVHDTCEHDEFVGYSCAEFDYGDENHG